MKRKRGITFSVGLFLLCSLLIGLGLGLEDSSGESPPKDSFLSTCMEVIDAITFYEDELQKYKYDDECAPYRYIGNAVLEKNNLKKNVISDGELFCESSFERKKSVHENGGHKSVYVNGYKEHITETFHFEEDQRDDCIGMVNLFNSCSTVRRSVFGDTPLIHCAEQSEKHFCNRRVQKMEDKNYIYTCSDMIVPYLLGAKNKEKTYSQMCHDVKDYAKVLKNEKNEIFKKKKKNKKV
ncbi:hypothetical protein PCYB_094200 [Plasmodium cynomolgi strain B]|uniref:CYIR protein n=1 Tax=Plasmodium cynomolgi (strain B) TaxID=1120755 RepID=K6UDI0_PLACD|nr:hypothetical protein PCYB_094200 [Plasmodium cynomolgi strain B]GAB66636.1 hypothetical protein PCYB_094200 [Plasmodium cynomolgi strain B]